MPVSPVFTEMGDMLFQGILQLTQHEVLFIIGNMSLGRTLVLLNELFLLEQLIQK